MKRVDGHSSHGDAGFVGGGVPVAAVDKRLNQPSTQHHGIKAKMKQDLARAEAHRRALATTALT